jgi:hypothetical protein
MPAVARAPHPHDTAADTRRTLVTHDVRAAHGDAQLGHDRQSRRNVARRIADVMGCAFGGDFDPATRYEQPPYFVPHDAMLADEARALGIGGPDHLFGGVVPYAFVATKAITHPLLAPDAKAPDGWSHAFADRVDDAVLRGYTTFAPDDARRAARALLRHGPVRIKCVSGIGGSGQHLVTREAEIEPALGAIDPREFGTSGVAVEEHLADGVTFSVGRVECAGLTIAYCGTQGLTRNGHGHEVYGGSTLDVVRGGFTALLARDLPDDRREAVALAQAYDDAAFTAYPGAFASRRNYDVLFGRDAAGMRRAGVLEQSWRIGGASGAEVVALAAFKRDAACSRVRCATVEIYDDACVVPADAFVYYRGVDERVGPLTKFAHVLDGQDAR